MITAVRKAVIENFKGKKNKRLPRTIITAEDSLQEEHQTITTVRQAVVKIFNGKRNEITHNKNNRRGRKFINIPDDHSSKEGNGRELEREEKQETTHNNSFNSRRQLIGITTDNHNSKGGSSREL